MIAREEGGGRREEGGGAPSVGRSGAWLCCHRRKCGAQPGGTLHQHYILKPGDHPPVKPEEWLKPCVRVRTITGYSVYQVSSMVPWFVFVVLLIIERDGPPASILFRATERERGWQALHNPFASEKPLCGLRRAARRPGRILSTQSVFRPRTTPLPLRGLLRKYTMTATTPYYCITFTQGAAWYKSRTQYMRTPAPMSHKPWGRT